MKINNKSQCQQNLLEEILMPSSGTMKKLLTNQAATCSGNCSSGGTCRGRRIMDSNAIKSFF